MQTFHLSPNLDEPLNLELDGLLQEGRTSTGQGECLPDEIIEASAPAGCCEADRELHRDNFQTWLI